MSFENKTVVVTGASSGIGAATAIYFAKEGANVVMIARNQKKLDAVAAKVSSVGKKPLIVNADVSKDSDAKRIISDTIAKFGKLDVLVNNAGFGKDGTILNGKVLEAYDAIMSVNVRAVIHLTTLAAPHLATTKGNIVNISSIASMLTPSSAMMAYYVSKAALDHFTRGAALELASSGIRVNSINPGPVQTDFLDNNVIDMQWENLNSQTALNRTSGPEEIADMVLYLASDKAKGITGSCIVHDNGYLVKNS